MFSKSPESIMTQSIKGVTVEVPVSVLARGVPIVLDSLDTKFNEISNVESSEYIKLLKARKPSDQELYNDPVFQIRDLDINSGGCVIHGSTTDYFSMVATHEAMQNELLSVASELKHEGRLTVANLNAALPRRKRFLKQSSQDMRKFCSLSVSTLLAFKTRTEGYKLISRKRSGKTAADRNVFHVVPAGMLQDVWSIEHCVIKEYCEELFGEVFDTKREDPDYIYRESPSAREIKAAIASGACELLHAGLVLNLMSLRPEICCVLLVHEAELFESHKDRFALNWEFIDRKSALKMGQRETMIYYHLDRVEEEFLGENSQEGVTKMVADWAPVGLAAFWLGIEATRRRLGV
jgi:hypothetical protein